MTCQNLIATCDDPSDIIHISVNTAGNFEVFQKKCEDLYKEMEANQKLITDGFANSETDPGERLKFYENINLEKDNVYKKLGDWVPIKGMVT